MIAPRENAHCPTGHKNKITDCKAHESGGEGWVGGVGGSEKGRRGGNEEGHGRCSRAIVFGEHSGECPSGGKPS